MNSVDEKKVKLLIHSIGLKHNLQDEVIKTITSSPYKFTKKILSELELEEIAEEEEFLKQKTNFIYIYIGKLYASYKLHIKNLNSKKK